MTMNPTTKEIWDALVESVKLQSHYADLLNQHDGGERSTFVDANAWIQRMRAVSCNHHRVIRGCDAPRRYGSWRTQVCLACGSFRTHGHNDDPDPARPWGKHSWQPASEYAEAIADREDL